MLKSGGATSGIGSGVDWGVGPVVITVEGRRCAVDEGGAGVDCPVIVDVGTASAAVASPAGGSGAPEVDGGVTSVARCTAVDGGPGMGVGDSGVGTTAAGVEDREGAAGEGPEANCDAILGVGGRGPDVVNTAGGAAGGGQGSPCLGIVVSPCCLGTVVSPC